MIKNKETKKEVKCRFCGKIFDERDMKTYANTDKLLRWNWGIPIWEQKKCCPNCGCILKRE